MKLYGIPNCSTVKKSRIWLDDHGIDYTFHDFKKQGIDQTTLEHWLSQMPWEKLVNRAGMTWRGLSEETKSSVIDNASAIMVMMNSTSVIKRPVLVKDDKIICLGFDETTYRKLL
jgi:arsenate reductase (glutaredoxin)